MSYEIWQILCLCCMYTEWASLRVLLQWSHMCSWAVNKTLTSDCSVCSANCCGVNSGVQPQHDKLSLKYFKRFSLHYVKYSHCVEFATPWLSDMSLWLDNNRPVNDYITQDDTMSVCIQLSGSETHCKHLSLYRLRGNNTVCVLYYELTISWSVN